MTNRATRIVPRIVLAGVVASAALVTVHLHAASADECLTKPKGSAPDGQHWYYHNERGSKRQCWYLGDKGSRGASLGVRKSAAAVAHQHHQLSQTEADARAEFAPPAAPASDSKRAVVGAVATTPVEPSPMAAATPGTAAAPETAPTADSSTPAPAPAPDSAAVTADQSSVASRWPGATEAAQPTEAPPPNPATVTMAAAELAPAASADSSTAVTAADSSATDSGSPGMAALTSTIDSSRTRLFAFLGAVALAGFSISVLVARARARRRIRVEPAMARRRPRWPADPTIDQMQLPEAERYPSLARGSEPASRRAAGLSIIPRDDARYDEQYEVEDLLARYGGQGRSAR